MEKKGEDYKAVLAAEEGADNGQAEASETAAPAQEASISETVAAPTPNPVVATAPAAATTDSDKRLKASPLARKMASEAGIDIAQLSGSGDAGRIIKRDVESFLQNQPAATPSAPATEAAPQEAPPAVPAFSFNGTGDNYTDIPLSQMRKVIARRLGESKYSAPHFYLTVEIDMEKTIAARKQINEIAPVRISFNDIIVKASAAALRQHPAINSSWLGDKIRQNGSINIGVAVAVDEGLLVPVIHHADMKSLSQIKVEIKDLAAKAKNRKLQPQEMQGNTFTISNLGDVRYRRVYGDYQSARFLHSCRR